MDYTKLNGLIPAVVQDDATGDVLMVGFMNEDAFARTRETGFVTFFSRTRSTLWTKGETSGNRLEVVSMAVDCDQDSVLVRVNCLGSGKVCHTGERSCFGPADRFRRSSGESAGSSAAAAAAPDARGRRRVEREA